MFPLCIPSGPDKKSMISDDLLGQLLDEELEAEVTLAQRLSSSPPQALPLTHSHTPLRKAHRAPVAQDAFPLKPASVVLNRPPPSATNSPPSPARDESTRSESPLSHLHSIHVALSVDFTVDTLHSSSLS